MSPALRFCAAAAFGAVSLLTPAAALAEPAGDVQEVRCDWIGREDRELIIMPAPELNVLQDTARGGDYRPALRSGASSILCTRSSIVPAAHDDEVIWLGLPLHISEAGRLAVLEIDQGRYRFRMIRGRLREGEQPAIDARLAEFQARFTSAQATQ